MWQLRGFTKLSRYDKVAVHYSTTSRVIVPAAQLQHSPSTRLEHGGVVAVVSTRRVAETLQQGPVPQTTMCCAGFLEEASAVASVLSFMERVRCGSARMSREITVQ